MSESHSPVIRARQVTKTFQRNQRPATSVKELFIRRPRHSASGFTALRDVSLDVGRGETVALLGANGGGKSTLLKVLAGILPATDGEVEVNGRISSMLELGTGFNGELSGHDNIYLNASLLGLSRSETEALYDDIVDFSELGDHIQGLVKNYSSGMYVRLGFAVAVHVDPDILLVDEVLAVGDEAFQQKCLARIRQFQEDGRTILFVSHSLGLVEELCSRAVVLDHGKLVHDGDVRVGTSILRGLLGIGGTVPGSSGEVSIEELDFRRTADSSVQSEFWPGDPMRAELTLSVAQAPAAPVHVRVVVIGPGGSTVLALDTLNDSGVTLEPGRVRIDFSLESLPALVGTFSVGVGVVDALDTQAVLAWRTFDGAVHMRGDQSRGVVDVPFSYTVRRF